MEPDPEATRGTTVPGTVGAGGSAAGAGTGVRHAPEELRTERLLLRPWRAADRAPFAAMNADPEVMRFIGSGVLDPVGSDGMRARLRREWSRAGHGLWAVEGRDGGDFLGFCGLTAVPFGLPAAAGAIEIGWRLPRTAWGHGYATEAARAALEVAWSALGASSVVALVHPENDRSLAVGERLGMRVVGTTLHPPSGWRVLVLRAERPADGLPPRPHADPTTRWQRGRRSGPR